jgi:hypothetical protein
MKLAEKGNFLLFVANGKWNGKFPFVYYEQKWKTEVCFPCWANDTR